MKKRKKLFVSIILLLITTLSVCFILLDFSRFFYVNYSYDIFPSAILKRICVILAASISWSVGRDGLNPRDSREIKAAFLFACLGEAAFAIGERILGVGMFGLCQALLIIRNGTGFSRGLALASCKKKKSLLTAGMVVLLINALFAFLFDWYVNSSSTTAVVFTYAILLSISLWTGLACYILVLLPEINSRMAAAGMICFFCCDMLVGLDVVLEVGIPWLLANSLIWVFYMPALVLLALSSYSYDKRIE